MKINKKEKMLLSFLAFVLIGVGYYNFIYTNQRQKIESLDIERTELETEYNKVIETINTLTEKQEKISALTSKINLKAKEFYPAIIQEKIILELDEYIKVSKLDGNITFTEVVVEVIEDDGNVEKDNKQSTFEKFVKEYNGEVEIQSENQDEINESINNEQVTNEEETTEEIQPTVEHIKSTLTFKGTYKSVQDFISKIEASGRNTVITELSTSAGLNGELTGNLNLEFFAIPKINNKDNEYLQWTIIDTYGKSMPFIIEKPVEVTPESIGAIGNQTSNGDFSIIVKSSASDLPSVLISKIGDSKNETVINAENKNIEEVNFELNKVNDKYYYKYKTSNSYYPKEYTGNGIEFTPSQDKIMIDVLSEARVNVDDKSGIKINVNNNTGKLVDVVVSNDDPTNPRVKVIGEKGKVTMTKK